MRLLLPALAAALLIGGTLGGCGAPPEEPKPSALAPAQMTPGQKFLKAKLAELDQIGETPGFREYKFSATGPYAGWPDKLKAEAQKKDLGMWEMGGVNFLALLASNDASSGGVDDASTEQARSHEQEVIDTPQ
jgi:hypothetical protein